MATQSRAGFQFIMEQQRRQAEMFQFQMQYLYHATGIQPPQFPLPVFPIAGMSSPQPQQPPQAPGSFSQPQLPQYNPVRPVAQFSPLHAPLNATIGATIPKATSETPVLEILHLLHLRRLPSSLNL